MMEIKISLREKSPEYCFSVPLYTFGIVVNKDSGGALNPSQISHKHVQIVLRCIIIAN